MIYKKVAHGMGKEVNHSTSWQQEPLNINRQIKNAEEGTTATNRLCSSNQSETVP